MQNYRELHRSILRCRIASLRSTKIIFKKLKMLTIQQENIIKQLYKQNVVYIVIMLESRQT